MGAVMSNEERFMARVREEASALRYQPDAMALTRMSARIRMRIAQPVSVSLLLSRWFRPVAASFAALAVTASLSLIWIERTPEQPVTLDQVSAAPVVISMDGDSYNVGD